MPPTYLQLFAYGSKHENEDVIKPISRRSALRTIVFGSGILYLQGCTGGWLKSRSTALHGPFDSGDIGPVDRTLGDIAPAQYYGDEVDRAHQHLWNIKSDGLPAPTERTSLVVVGAGMSGLATAFLHQEQHPIILEHASRLGGNAKAQSWKGLDYSIGAAYFMQPDEGSAIEKLYQETGIMDVAKKVDAQGSFLLDGKLGSGFWEGDTDPKHREQFVKLKAYFTEVLSEENGLLYPAIPFEGKEYEDLVKRLDQETFLEHVEKIAGGKLHAHIRSCMEHYCWSSFGASMSEIGAASGLNFYCAEFGGTYVMPGGNAGAAEQIYKKLSQRLPRNNIRTMSTVINVRATSDGAVVTYADRRGQLRSIAAKAVVMSCPKFVVKHVLEGIEPERKSAIERLSYRAYLVANVLLKNPLKKNFYDMYLIRDQEVFGTDTKAAAIKQKITDIVNGTYAQVSKDRSILTLYRGMPYDGGRTEIFSADSYAFFKEEFQRQTFAEILPALGFETKDVVDIRISRFGHALPVAQKGKIADGTAELLRKPFQNKVFFVEQDNWMLPALETGLEEALFWKEKIAGLL